MSCNRSELHPRRNRSNFCTILLAFHEQVVCLLVAYRPLQHAGFVRSRVVRVNNLTDTVNSREVFTILYILLTYGTIHRNFVSRFELNLTHIQLTQDFILHLKPSYGRHVVQNSIIITSYGITVRDSIGINRNITSIHVNDVHKDISHSGHLVVGITIHQLHTDQRRATDNLTITIRRCCLANTMHVQDAIIVDCSMLALVRSVCIFRNITHQFINKLEVLLADRVLTAPSRLFVIAIQHVMNINPFVQVNTFCIVVFDRQLRCVRCQCLLSRCSQVQFIFRLRCPFFSHLIDCEFLNHELLQSGEVRSNQRIATFSSIVVTESHHVYLTTVVDIADAVGVLHTEGHVNLTFYLVQIHLLHFDVILGDSTDIRSIVKQDRILRGIDIHSCVRRIKIVGSRNIGHYARLHQCFVVRIVSLSLVCIPMSICSNQAQNGFIIIRPNADGLNSLIVGFRIEHEASQLAGEAGERAQLIFTLGDIRADNLRILRHL